MTASRRILATALVLSMQMVLQSAAKTTSLQKYTAEYRENKENSNNQTSGATTIFPVNPYVFSVEDYDILQEAESLQKALSIVAYEPQKLDPKKSESKILKNNQTSEKSTLPSDTMTKLPLEKKYYEVPRKQSRTRMQAKFERKPKEDDASNLAAEASSLRHIYQTAPENNRVPREYKHRTNPSISLPSARAFTRNSENVASPAPPLPLYPPLTERTSSANLVKAQDNYPITRTKDSRVHQNDNETSKTEVKVPTVKKKWRKSQSNQQKEAYRHEPQQQQASLLISKDRVPRPFSFTTDSNLTTEPVTYLTRSVSKRQHSIQPPTPATEKALDYPVKSSRQSIPKATASVEDPVAHSSIPLRQRARVSAPNRYEQTVPYSTISVSQEQIPYSTAPIKLEQESNYQTEPVRRPSRPNRPLQRTETHLTTPDKQPVTYSTAPTNQGQPVVYTIPRRRDQVAVRSRQEKASTRSTASSKDEHSAVRSTAPTRREQIIARSTVPTRQESAPTYSDIPTMQEQPQVPYSTVPVKQEQVRNYQTIPSRRNTARSKSPTETIQINPIVSVEQTAVTHSNFPTKRKAADQNIQYEDDIAPPTVSVEQNLGYPTIAQPSYIPRIHEQNKAQSKTTSQENDYYKEYVSDDNYNDYTENINDKDNNIKNKSDTNGNDNNHYSYSYNERYVEPIEDEPSHNPAYKVNEETSDYPEQTAQRVQTYPALQRGAYKKVESDYYQDQVQYIEPQTTQRDPDYDQIRGQNVQLEVAQVHQAQEPRGEEKDVVAQADHHHHKKHHKPKKEHHEGEEGGADEHHEGEHHEHGEKSEKGYKEFHEHDEGEKGHHDKEGHNHEYDEKEGKAKKHHDEAGYHEEHEKGEEGEKKTTFSEKGDHKKGHSTKGEHVIHKKDEYEKKTEFFDEFQEGGDHEKDGGHHEEHHHKKGGHYKKGYHHKGHHEKKHGEKGHHDKGHHHHEKKGHDEHEGHDHHHHHEEKHGKKGAHEDAKHWHHKKGDRR